MPHLVELSTDVLVILIRLGLMSVSYWLLDQLIQHERLWSIASRLRLERATAARTVGLGLLLLLSLGFRWENVGAPVSVKLVAFGLMALLTWKLSTTDIDVVVGERHTFARLLMVFAWVAMWWNPVWVVVP